jgi:phosphosulfolactate synthase
MPSFLELPERSEKPRRAGITHVLDRGLSPLALESLLVSAGRHIDLIKLGWGPAYVSGAVADKVAICRDAGVAICPGGTLLEIAVHQGKLEGYLEWLRELGIDHVEVSNGSLPMARGRKAELIRRLAGEFTVIAEVGSKGTEDAVAVDWCEEMLSDLAAGAVLVIAEGRESGTVGLFDAAGEVHGELVDAILRAVGQETVIFEAPQRAQQAWLLNRVGPNVNLGNIATEDVIALETLRRGLRYDTLALLPTGEAAPPPPR